MGGFGPGRPSELARFRRCRLSCHDRAIRVVAAAIRAAATRTTRAGQLYAAATQLTSRPPTRRLTMAGKVATRARTARGGTRPSTTRTREWADLGAQRREGR